MSHISRMRHATVLLFLATLAQAQTPAGRWISNLKYFDQDNYARMELELNGAQLTGKVGGDAFDGTFVNGEINAIVRANPKETLKLQARLDSERITGTAIILEWKAEYKWEAVRDSSTSAPPKTHNFEPIRFHNHFSIVIAPALRINPGDTVKTWTVDASGADPKDARITAGGNPLTGPFYVEGALPGDTLVVHFKKIRLNRDTATSASPIVGSALTPGYLMAVTSRRFADWGGLSLGCPQVLRFSYDAFMMRGPSLLCWLLSVMCWFNTGLVLGVEDSKLDFPAKEWERVKPETLGYSSQRLEVLRAWLKTQHTTALHVSVRGRVIFEYGDLGRVSKVASVRKSILAMLYGNFVAKGKIDPNSTVEQLGLTDVQPFLPVEKTATLQHLLTARSGIYLPTANEELSAHLPRRGTQTPGTYFQYQNWDFNAAGTAFEKLTGKDIFVALEEDLAKPIGMQDFDRTRQRKNNEMPITRHPEYAMYLSTRDMARLGLLMLADGCWRSNQLMPKGWAGQLTTLVTHSHELHPMDLGAYQTNIGRWGYGMLWWVWDAPVWPGTMTGPYQGAFTAIGSNGQYITVLPAAEMVFAHKVDFDEDGSRHISPAAFQTILQMVLESYCSDKCK